MNSTDRNVLVTGVSRGIGERIALFLLNKGWSVFSISRTKSNIVNPNFFWYECDVTDANKIAEILGSLSVKFDCVINNAAISGQVGPSLSIPLEEWKNAFEVNFFACLNITKSVIENCNHNGCFIYLSGGGAVTPKPLTGPYNISKLSVVKLVEQLSLEYKDFRFYAMAPGVHNTKLFKEQSSKLDVKSPEFADPVQVEQLIETFINDIKGSLNGKLIHIRDDLGRLLSIKDGGNIRRVQYDL